MKQINTEELKEKINSGENFVLDLYATWCGPCKVMLSNLTKVNELLLGDEYKDKQYSIYKFDVDSDREYAMEELGLRSVPTVKVYKGGNEVMSKVGIMSVTEVLNIISNN